VGRLSLFWRLFAVYAAVGAIAVVVLVFAPISVSVPTAPREVVVLVVGFAIALVVYLVVLWRVMAPLERLTGLMRRIDPLTPGRRVDIVGGDPEVVALTEAFNEMLDRLETERRESALRALAAQEAERQRIARELHDEIGQTLTGLVLRSETIARRARPCGRPLAAAPRRHAYSRAACGPRHSTSSACGARSWRSARPSPMRPG